MWQEIAIILIGIAVIGCIGYKIYRLLTTSPKDNACIGCSGCALKKEMRSRQKTGSSMCQEV